MLFRVLLLEVILVAFSSLLYAEGLCPDALVTVAGFSSLDGSDGDQISSLTELVDSYAESIDVHIDLLAKEKEGLEYELQKPSAFRTERDPRMFGFLTPWRNPIILRLKDDIARAEEDLGELREAKALNDEVRSTLNLMSGANLSSQDIFVFESLVDRLSSLFEDIFSGLKPADLDEEFETYFESGGGDDIESISESLEIFKTHIAKPIQSRGMNPLWQDVEQRQVEQRDQDEEEIVEDILGRELDFSYTSRLGFMSRSLNIEMEDVVRRFKQIDRAGENMSGRGNIDDPFVVYLTSLSLGLGISAADIVQRFREIDMLGESFKEGGWIYDLDVALLTGLSLKNDISSHEVVSLFYKIEEAFEKHDFEAEAYLGARLTDLAYRNKLTATQVVGRYMQIKNLGDTTKAGYHIAENSVASLTDMSFNQNLSAKNLVDMFFEIETHVENKVDPDEEYYLEDIDLTSLVNLAYTYNLSAKQIVDLFVRVYQLQVRELHDTELISTLQIVLSAKSQQKVGASNVNFVLSDQELISAMGLAVGRESTSMEEWVIEDDGSDEGGIW